jgi:hypothetical protein
MYIVADAAQFYTALHLSGPPPPHLIAEVMKG